MPKILLPLLLLAFATACAAETREWSPRQFGAVADGTTLDTAALQQAIDAAHAAGGGTVRVPAGRYCTGTLDLRTGVTLHLETGAVVLGSPRLADYRRGHWPAIIKACLQERIAITGPGTIDGQGKLVAQDSIRLVAKGDFLGFFPGLPPGQRIDSWNGERMVPGLDPHKMHAEGKLAARVDARARNETWRVEEPFRPQLIEFLGCRDVQVRGVTLSNAANWVQTYRNCEDLVIAGIRVDSTAYWNNDGIDVVDCRRVRIEDCVIDAADDGICLKSSQNVTGRGCEDITVARCRVRSSASAFKLGTGSHVAFRRIRVEDLEVFDTFRSAVALETVDGAVLEDITITRVRARNTGNAFFLRIGQRNKDKPPGVLRNVVLSDFTCEVPARKPDIGYDHEGPPEKTPTNLQPASIIGLPDRAIENVVLRNITVVYGGGARRDRAELPLSALGSIPERRDDYPEFSRFGELPAWALFVRHARGIRLENVSFSLAAADFRSAIVADRVDGFHLDRVSIVPGGGEPVVALAGVSGESFTAMAWPASARETVRRLPALFPVP